jgi:hypothetical protein
VGKRNETRRKQGNLKMTTTAKLTIKNVKSKSEAARIEKALLASGLSQNVVIVKTTVTMERYSVSGDWTFIDRDANSIVVSVLELQRTFGVQADVNFCG